MTKKRVKKIKKAKKATKKKANKKTQHKKKAAKPEQKPKKRTNKQLQAAFLKAFMYCGNISLAADSAKIERGSHYRWMREDEDYPELFQLAKEQATGNMEDEAQRRAQIGCDEPVFYQGKVCGHKKVYSDTLMIFLLKGLHPEKYRERVDNRLSGQVAQTVNIIASGEGKKEDGK